MVRNKLAMAVLALSVLQANVAGALGLGNLSVKSALNQPLNAEIKLLDIGELDAGQIRIQLGSPDDFQRAAVERDYFLTNLKFTVDLDGRGGGVVHISTREAVVEPYLNFVIEARWPNGRVLREFAVLLDPPTFNANRASAPVAPATSAAPAPKPRRAPEPPTVTTEAAPTPAPASMALPAAEKGGEYRIQVYDTLSKIAAQHRPAADVSVEQTMLAIQRANPQVFIRNNVNLIKSGYVIRLPSADEARAIDAAQASAEVEDQIRAWRGGTPRGSAPAPVASGPQLDARAPEPASEEGGHKEQARLSIAAPGGSDKSSAGEGAGGAASGKGVEALRNQLTASQESLEKGRRDNQELQSRLDDMERQIATLQKLISLKDDQLAALQAKSAQADAAPAPAAATPAPATPAPAVAPETAAPAAEPAAPAAETAAPATQTAAPPAAAPAATTTTSTITTKTTAAAPAPAAEPGLVEQLTANPLYLGGAAAVVALLAGLAIQRRRKAAEEERDAASDFLLDDQVDFTLDNATDHEPARIDDAATAVVAEAVAAERADTRANQAQPVRSETGDAIAEADIYIAYGRYQQAVDLLSHAIDAEPARSDLRVKLLEVCLEMRNREAFRQQFVALQGLGDGDAVAHAKDLLSSVDGVSDWLVDLPQAQRPVNEVVASAAVAATAATAAIAAADTLEHEASIGEDESDFVEPNAFAPAPAAAPADSDELDLDLDDLGLGDELPADAELELEDGAGALNFDKELADLELDDDLGGELELGGSRPDAEPDLEGGLDLGGDLDLDGELDLDAPLDLDGELDLDKELELSAGTDLEQEIDLDRGATQAFAPADETVSADELAEDLDLEAHPGLDSEFDLDAELDGGLQAAAEPALGELEALGGEPAEPAEKLEYDFEIEDTEDDLAAVPPGKTTFDLDSTSIELAGGPSPVATPEETTAVAAEPALDLADDLDLALDEMGETGYLNDAERVADALHDLDAPAPAAEPAADLSDEFDLGNLEAELPEIDRLDLGAGALPDLEPVADAELPDLAPELPPEFDAEAAARDAETETGLADADDEFDFLADADEIATKLDLARAYIDMGDTDGARDILDEVMQEGTDTQRQEASSLLDRIA